MTETSGQVYKLHKLLAIGKGVLSVGGCLDFRDSRKDSCVFLRSFLSSKGSLMPRINSLSVLCLQCLSSHVAKVLGLPHYYSRDT